MMKRWLVFDTETTGLLKPEAGKLEDQPHIIELALVEIIDYQIHSKHSWLINPGCSLTDEITKITGLKDSDLENKPRFAAVVGELIEWFTGAHGLIAHNLPFDRGMLVTELRRLGKEFAFPYPGEQICTVAAYEHTKGRRMKLTELYLEVMKRELTQTHRALDDTVALGEIVIEDAVI